MIQKRTVQSRTWVESALVLLLTVMPCRVAAGQIKGAVTLVSSEEHQGKKPDRAGAVVWLEPAGPTVRPPPGRSQTAAVKQRNMTFIPHLLAVEVGTAVDFPNNDPIFHNVFSNFDGQVFDLQLYAPQTARRVVFRRPGIVHVFCNVHEAMNAVIAVLPTPYFAVSDGTGRFEIPVPPGEYRVQFWHERALPARLAGLEQRVIVGGAPLTLPDTLIAVSDQPTLPHKDKYGHEYAQRPEDRVFYQGSRR